MTYGYEYSDGKVIPVTKPEGNPNKEYILRCLGYMKEFSGILSEGIKDDLQNIHDHDLVWICEELLKTCMSDPTREESNAFGKMLFNDDVLPDADYSLAGKWSDGDIKKNAFLRKMVIKSGMKGGEIPKSGWPEGSITNSCTGFKRKMSLFSERASKTVTEIRKTIKA